jgi:uncharacterized membrane protein YkvA (DUF1232 family)
MSYEDKDKDMTANSEAIKNDFGFWRDLWQQARLVYALIKDPSVPIYLKLIPFAAVLYLVFPLDLIPDIALGLGQLDDLTAILVMSKVFIELAPQHIVDRHLTEIRGYDGYEHNDDAVIIDQDVAESIKFKREDNLK